MTEASIITIGDELLIGQVIDTNSAWIAQELNKAGIRVKRRVAVGDVWEEIWTALDEESQQVPIVLITGGLGPTADDITKPLLCKYFNGQLVVNQAALANVTYLFEQVFKRPLTERNLKQAEVPDTCTVIQNKRGTAPGMWFEQNGTIFMSMPGVPNEMKGMMTNDVIPLLQQRFTSSHIAHRTLVTFGIGESSLADLVQDFEAALPHYIKLAYLPNYGLVRLRLTGTGSDDTALEKELDHLFEQLQVIVKDYMITNRDENMQETVARILKSLNRTMGTAESCTGGYIASLLTAQPGASAYFEGSVVSYSNAVKQHILGVEVSTLETSGAVSEATVTAMVRGALAQLQTDYAVAVSGIMGPDGGSEEKPVGTVWVAAASKTQVQTQRFHFRFGRQQNIELTAMNALNLLRKLVLSETGL